MMAAGTPSSPSRDPRRTSRFSRRLLGVLCLALAYALLGRLGLAYAIPPGTASALFPASGVALAVLCLRGTSLWPGVWLGSFVGTLWAVGIDAHVGMHPGVLLAIAVTASAATLQAITGTLVLSRLNTQCDPTTTVRDFVRFALIAAALVSTISPTIGLTAFATSGVLAWAAYGHNWGTWWVGDTTGVLLFAPLIFVWSKRPSRDWLRRLLPEGLLLLAMVLFLILLTFSPWSSLARRHTPLIPVFLPLLVWGALRFGRHGVSLLVLLIMSAAVWGAQHGAGPFTAENSGHPMWLIAVYVACITTMVFSLTAALAERDRATASLEQRVAEQTQELRVANEQLSAENRERARVEQELRRNEALLQAILDSLPFDVWANDISGRYILLNNVGRRHWGENFIGRRPSEIGVAPEVAELWEANNARARSGEMVTGRVRYTVEGEERSYENILLPVRLDGELIGSVGVNVDITAREQYEASLKASAATYRSIFQAIPDAIFVHDIETGAIVDVNERMLELYDCTREDLPTVDLGKLSAGPPLYTAEEAVRRMQTALAGNAGSFEWMARSRSGRVFWVEVSLKRATINGQERLLAIVRDIGERKQVELRLREQRARLRLLVEHLPAIVWTTDRNLVLTSAEGSGLTRLGVSPAQLAGQSIQYPHMLAAVERALSGERATCQDTWLDRTFDSWVEPLRDADGQIIGTIGLSIDITERKQLERERAQVEQRLGVVLNRAPLVVFSLNRDGVFTLSEGLGLAALGMKPGQLVGQSAFEVYRDEPDILAAAHRALTGEEFMVTQEVRTPHLFWQTAWAPLRDETGAIEGVVGVATNVTERVQAERDRDRLLEVERTARMAAEEAVRVRDDFLSIASHELKTPITTLQYGVQGLLQLSRHGLLSKAPPETLQSMLVAIERQGKRLTRFVNVLLDVSRIESGTLELAREQVDLAALTREICEQHAEETRRSGCTVTVNAPRPVTGDWDRFRLEQVISNLVTNALKYGGAQPVDVSVEEKDGVARLSVTDRGIGISPEQQARLFNRFERAVSARHYSGLGLGLYIARRIVEAHGGSIRVESRLGAGATFIVELPRQLPVTAAPSATVEAVHG